MFHAFFDESGTTDENPLRIAGGVIVPQVRYDAAVNCIETLYDLCVPPLFRSGFRFHAEPLVHDNRYKEGGWGWHSPGGRRDFIHIMMQMPGFLGLPIVWAATRKDSPFKSPYVTDVEFGHISAFLHCVGAYDRFLGAKGATGRLWVEDVQLSGRLDYAFSALRAKPLAPNAFQHVLSFGEQLPVTLGTKLENQRILEKPVFITKDATNAELLPLADVVCYGMRAFCAGTKYGDEYGRMLFRNDPQRFEVKKKTNDHAFSFALMDWGPSLPPLPEFGEEFRSCLITRNVEAARGLAHEFVRKTNPAP